MKKTYLIAAFIMSATWAHCQTTLSFCTFVNSSTQECIFDNTKFITSPDSTRVKLFMMMKASQPFGVSHFIYKMYAIDRSGEEVFLSTLRQDVQADWMSAWQPGVFVSPGKYMVKVYSDEEHLVTSKGFEFFNH